METGQSILYDMKASRLRWAGHAIMSNPLGSLCKNMNTTISARGQRTGLMPFNPLSLIISKV